MHDYTGCTVRYGFLDDSLGEHAKDAQSFADLVEEKLQDEFPGAEVQVLWEHNAGSKPWNLRTAAYDADGDLMDGEVDHITEIVEDVFSSGVWIS